MSPQVPQLFLLLHNCPNRKTLKASAFLHKMEKWRNTSQHHGTNVITGQPALALLPSHVWPCPCSRATSTGWAPPEPQQLPHAGISADLLWHSTKNTEAEATS